MKGTNCEIKTNSYLCSNLYHLKREKWTHHSCNVMCTSVKYSQAWPFVMHPLRVLYRIKADWVKLNNLLFQTHSLNMSRTVFFKCYNIHKNAFTHELDRNPFSQIKTNVSFIFEPSQHNVPKSLLLKTLHVLLYQENCCLNN